MTPTEIAATIRQHSPGALPESVYIVTYNGSPRLAYRGVGLYSDIAEAILRDAMVMDGPVMRASANDGWLVVKDSVASFFHDINHEGPLESCFAAWKFAKGIA